jgi:hypothetical protein
MTKRKIALTISELPSEALASIAAYLPKTAVGFLAAAMPDDGTKVALVSSMEWESIDFLDIDKDVRLKLTDEDLDGFLRGIDAVSKVKCLKFSHLFAVTGHGLESLRGSTVLEGLDLSNIPSSDFDNSSGSGMARFYDWESGQFSDSDREFLRDCGGLFDGLLEGDKTSLSLQIMAPILESIIDTDSLRHLQFPNKWIKEDSEQFHNLFTRFKDHLNSSNPQCSNCPNICGIVELRGIQLGTCYSCLKNICMDCGEPDFRTREDNVCSNCNKYFCGDCATSTSCSECSARYCNKCNGDGRNENRFGLNRECELCGETYCRKCNPIDDCIGCSRWMCGKCERLIFHQGWGENVCERCYEDRMDFLDFDDDYSEDEYWDDTESDFEH